jgi:hypothetical protein
LDGGLRLNQALEIVHGVTGSAKAGSTGYHQHPLADATSDMRADRELVLAAVALHPYALQYASTGLRTHRDVVVAAIQVNGRALQYASEALQSDPSVVLLALHHGFELRHVSHRISVRGNQEMLLAAVAHDGNALNYASDELISDAPFMLQAIARNRDAIWCAAPQLVADKGFVLAIVTLDGEALAHLPDYSQEKDVVLAAVTQNGMALRSCSQYNPDGSLNITGTHRGPCANDREIVLAAVQQNGRALVWASRELQDDREMQLAARKAIARDGFGPPGDSAGIGLIS